MTASRPLSLPALKNRRVALPSTVALSSTAQPPDVGDSRPARAGGDDAISGGARDDPRKFSRMPATVWSFRGCSMNCQHCSQRGIAVPVRAGDAASSGSSVARRANSGIVLTGGEVTIHAGLPPMARYLRDQGMAIKLDTNGSRLRVLRFIRRKLLQYVAMDVKASVTDGAVHDAFVAARGMLRVRASLHVWHHATASMAGSNNSLWRPPRPTFHARHHQ